MGSNPQHSHRKLSAAMCVWKPRAREAETGILLGFTSQLQGQGETLSPKIRWEAIEDDVCMHTYMYSLACTLNPHKHLYTYTMHMHACVHICAYLHTLKWHRGLLPTCLQLLGLHGVPRVLLLILAQGGISTIFLEPSKAKQPSCLMCQSLPVSRCSCLDP